MNPFTPSCTRSVAQPQRLDTNTGNLLAIVAEALEAAHALLRARCPALTSDRYMAPDIEIATALVGDGSLSRILRDLPALSPLWIAA